MRRAAPALLAAALLAGTVQAQDGGVEAGRHKARACAVCHGPLGLASQPDAPHLAGQSAVYLTTQLKAYRSGARRHEVMSLMARSLSDEDIAQLAAWFASIRVEAREPP